MKRRQKKKIRYAVVGQGYFAQTAVLPAFAHSKSSELCALVSGNRAKLKLLGRKYGVQDLYNYDQYDLLMTSSDIDAVYIALPNWMHREYAEKALEAGIHVLCEKPMAVTSEDCRSMIRTAEARDLKLMIAYRLHFEQANLESIEAIRSGKIGDPRIFHSVFSFPVKPGNIRAQAERIGGGPLFDIGIYCINASRYLFRSEPIEVFATAGDRPEGRATFDHETISVIMKFPEGRLANFTVSFGSSGVGHYEVVGTKGDLRLNEAYTYAGEMELSLTRGGNTRKLTFRKSDQIAPELDYFSRCVRKNVQPEPSGYEGLLDVMIIEGILESIRTGRPVALELGRKKRRPSLTQEIRRPAVEKPPRLYHADEPEKEAA
jgi:glucose-fructose oxidoreductase